MLDVILFWSRQVNMVENQEEAKDEVKVTKSPGDVNPKREVKK